MGKMLALVESPLQVDNLIEYLLIENKFVKIKVIVRYNGNNKNDFILKRKIELLLGSFPCVNVVNVKIKPKSFKLVPYVFSVLFLSLKFKPTLIVYGDLRSTWNNVLFGFHSRRCTTVIIDDGFATLSIYNRLRKICGIEIVFFTKFDLAETKNLKVIYSKGSDGKLAVNRSLDRCVFVGSPVVEKDIISSDMYISILKRIVDDNSEIEVSYCFHRGEHLLNDSDLIDIGFTNVLHLDSSIEDSIENEDIHLTKLSGLYSTALINASLKFYNLDIECYLLPKSCLMKNFDNIQNVYSYIALQEGITTKELHLC